MDSFSFGFKEQPILFLHWQPVTSRGRHVLEPSFPSNSATLSTLTTLICAIHRTGLKFGFHIEVFIRHNLRVKSKRVKVVLLHQSNVLLQFIFCPPEVSPTCNQRHFTCQLWRERAARLGLAVAMAVAREALGRMRMCMTYLMIVVVCEVQR